jgi:hypothetical protein
VANDSIPPTAYPATPTQDINQINLSNAIEFSNIASGTVNNGTNADFTQKFSSGNIKISSVLVYLNSNQATPSNIQTLLIKVSLNGSEIQRFAYYNIPWKQYLNLGIFENLYFSGGELEFETIYDNGNATGTISTQLYIQYFNLL